MVFVLPHLQVMSLRFFKARFTNIDASTNPKGNTMTKSSFYC